MLFIDEREPWPDRLVTRFQECGIRTRKMLLPVGDFLFVIVDGNDGLLALILLQNSCH